MPPSKPVSEFKEGDKLVNENGEFRVIVETYPGRGCSHCDHKPFSCAGIRCASTDVHGGFLLTEINYITHRLTK